VAAETAKCDPKSMPLSCIEGPSMAGDMSFVSGKQNFSFQLGFMCKQSTPTTVYMAVIAAYTADGSCERQVYVMTPADTWSANVESVRRPAVLDVIRADTPEIQACYRTRQEGCSCR
jgi:hypothetical protein